MRHGFAVTLWLFAQVSFLVVGFAFPADAAHVGHSYHPTKFTYDAPAQLVTGPIVEPALVVAPVDKLRGAVSPVARTPGDSYDSSANFVAPRAGGIAGTAARNADELLADGRQVRNNFPNSASPNEVLYRAGSDGSITHYQVYDDLGRPVMRVNLVGRAHGGIPTPHVQEYVLNTNPATGQTFVNKGPVRVALPEEIPS